MRKYDGENGYVVRVGINYLHRIEEANSMKNEIFALIPGTKIS